MLITGVICYAAVNLKFKLRFDDALDVVGVHLVGGIVGSLLLGFFADKAVNRAGRNGVFVHGGGFGLLGEQALAVVATLVYSFVVTFAIAWVVDKLFPGGLRVDEETEDVRSRPARTFGGCIYRSWSVDPRPGPRGAGRVRSNVKS